LRELVAIPRSADPPVHSGEIERMREKEIERERERERKGAL